MTELRPLLESTEDELERALLQSFRAELPGSTGLRDTALALGLAGSTAEALAAATSASTTTTATSTAATSGGAASTLGAASLGVVGKSLVGGALVSFLALTTLDHSLRPSASQSAPATAHAPGVAAVPRSLDASPTPSASVVPPISRDTELAPDAAPASSAAHPSLPRSEPDVVAPPALAIDAPSNATFALPARPEPPPGTTPNASLAAEIRLLDQARTALAQGNSAQAASLLDRYAANRPSAVLAQEAALLRVRLLLNQGDRAGAGQLARRILREHPESAHVDSLRSLAAEP